MHDSNLSASQWKQLLLEAAIEESEWLCVEFTTSKAATLT